MIVRIIRTAADNAAAVEGMTKWSSADAVTGKPSEISLVAVAPLTEALSVRGVCESS
jgi:hypothetical protein